MKKAHDGITNTRHFFSSKVYGKKLEEVTPGERRNAKTVNFSIIYGAGATNLSQQLDIKRKEATELIANYLLNIFASHCTENCAIYISQ